MILAIDPGTTESAYVHLSAGIPLRKDKVANQTLVELIYEWTRARDDDSADSIGTPPTHMAIEMFQSFGMPVGREVFHACMWIGRFIEAWQGPYTLVYRPEVKIFHCGNPRAKDPNVRAALLDRYGGREKAIGNRKSPGPLYKMKGDEFSALAIALVAEHMKGSRNG